MPENHNPDVIYLEADSEITEAIDQLKASTGHEVRLAVPGRSTMLQSAVNLKLLKKTASNAHKQLVLISTDKATLSLAAGLGLMVAKNVKAEAIVPDMTMLPPEVSNEPVVIEQSAQEASDLSKLSRNSKKSKNADSAGSFEKQHIDLAEEELATPSHHSQPLEGNKKSPKVPNFMGLNKKIAIIAGVIGGIILLILAYIFLPTAKATLIAKAQKTPVSVKFSLDASTRKSDYNQGIVAANQLSVTMDLSAQYTATGKKDVGTKASGSVTMKNASSSSPVTVPSGTTVESDGKKFTLNQAVTIPGASVSGGKIVPGTASVAITAVQNGDSYNFASAAFLVSGYTGLTANGSTSGGVSKIATVVTQADIDKAKKDMIDAATQRAKQEVEAKANSDEHAFAETFT
ncbi:hypothetical protein H0W80_03960, partial [Candidatus Saccharibacteria bacterium]|nr:hypothetical protein [Candidatus Saccharibacteria bacterium]